MVKNKVFEISDTETKTYESIEDLNFRHKHEGGGILSSDNLNEKGGNDPRVQAMFDRSKLKNSSAFYIQSKFLPATKQNDWS